MTYQFQFIRELKIRGFLEICCNLLNMVRALNFKAIVKQDEDGIFVTHCPALPGCISQGATRDEAQGNIEEAITGYLESLKKHGEPMPPSILSDQHINL